jgi:flagellar P-ring protein precursor FlgI
MRYRACVCLLCVLCIAGFSRTASAGVRIKDITDFDGARVNQLTGFGLVVGLNGTGSKSLKTQKVAVDLLQKFNVGGRLISGQQGDDVYKGGNISMVFVTAELGPFMRKGSRMDVTVSIFDDATSLQGGTLLMTPIRGVDGEIYATVQGAISVGGFVASGQAATVTKNHPTVGRIPSGAIIEKEALGEILCQGQIKLLLKQPDYATARSIAKVINSKVTGAAHTIDAGTIEVTVPEDRRNNVVPFASEVGLLEIIPDTTAIVVLNERTGTIVAGEQVQISTVAVAHGNLSIVTAENAQVSQPLPFARGETVVTPQTDIDVNEQRGGLKVVKRSVTVAELAKALNALGATPRDLIAIFQAIEQSGALHGQLKLI